LSKVRIAPDSLITHLNSFEELIIVINLVGKFPEREVVFIGFYFTLGLIA
jgi:hypothetical protein